MYSLEEAKVEVVLSNQILDFLQQRNLITGVNAQKVHKDLTTFIKNIKIKSHDGINEKNTHSMKQTSTSMTDWIRHWDGFNYELYLTVVKAKQL